MKAFIALAVAVSGLCAANHAAAQDASPRFPKTIDLSEPLLAMSQPTLVPLPRARSFSNPDPVKDGLIKGAVAGLLVAVILESDLGGEGADLAARDWAAMIAMGAGYGLVIDFLHPDRQPHARPGAQSPAIRAKFKLRF